MSKTVTVNDFNAKFDKLSKRNQKYIIAIQQALMYAQENEKSAKAPNEERAS